MSCVNSAAGSRTRSWGTDTPSKLSSYDVTKAPTPTKLRKPANGIHSSKISGMKFPSWGEQKIKRSNSASSQNSGSRNFPNIRRSLDAKGEQEVKDIVDRLTSPTASTQRKFIKLYPNTVLLNMNHYNWANMAAYKAFQKTLYSKNGTMKKPTAMNTRR